MSTLPETKTTGRSLSDCPQRWRRDWSALDLAADPIRQGAPGIFGPAGADQHYLGTPDLAHPAQTSLDEAESAAEEGIFEGLKALLMVSRRYPIVLLVFINIAVQCLMEYEVFSIYAQHLQPLIAELSAAGDRLFDCRFLV